jgi:transcriptional regulator with XRE-family HTH domain
MQGNVSKTRSPADQLIGMRIRECRMAVGLTEYQFGELAGVSDRQVHNYEYGINSVSAGRLYEIARGLGTPFEYFFEGLERNEVELPHRQRRLLDVMRSLGEIQDEKHKEVIRQLIRSLADK